MIYSTLNFISRWVCHIQSDLWRFEAWLKGVKLQRGVTFHGRPILSRSRDAIFEIGEGTRVHSALRSNPISCPSPCVLRAMGPGSVLKIGPRAGLSASIVVAAKSVEIGADTLVGAGVLITDNDFHSLGSNGIWGDLDFNSAKPVTIGSRVFIGTRAIVLKGVVIGDDCVIAAGSVVTKSAPSGSLIYGNPAVSRPRRA